MKLVEIGKTGEGRPMMMAIITSPENHKNLARYRDIAVRLARADGIAEDEARRLASQGKAVVWEDGGLHATEILNSQTLFWTAYQFVSQNDPETLRMLNDCILLLTPVNPDGLELTANWYMREPDPVKRNMQLPKLYDGTSATTTIATRSWRTSSRRKSSTGSCTSTGCRQIVYNAHQTGPQGAILFTPPFRDPFNYNYDPLVPIGIDMVSAAITHRFLMEGKAGSASRTESSYSTWSNGMERSTTYFHNQVGILTEISGNPTPMEIGLVLDRQLPHADVPLPIPPQKVWHFKQSIDYILSAQRAILDVASRNKDVFLFRMWRMGMNSIERGSKDYWTLQPSWIEEAKAAAAKEAVPERGGRENRVGAGQVVPSKYFDFMRTAARRDPRAYIIPSNQPDFLTATRFVNALIKAGIEVYRAPAEFNANGKSYPAGSYVSQNGAGIPSAPARHDGAAGSPERFLLPGWTASSAVQHDRLHAGLPDGRAVRSRARRVRRPAAEASVRRVDQDSRGHRAGVREHHGRLLPQSSTEGLVPRDQSSAERRGRGVLAEGSAHRGRRDATGRYHLHSVEADDEGSARHARARDRTHVHGDAGPAYG